MGLRARCMRACEEAPRRLSTKPHENIPVITTPLASLPPTPDRAPLAPTSNPVRCAPVPLVGPADLVHADLH